MLFVVLQARSM